MQTIYALPYLCTKGLHCILELPIKKQQKIPSEKD